MTTVLAEVAAVLAKHGGVACALTVEVKDGGVRLTIETEAQMDLYSVELLHELRYVADIATMRALCAKYDISTESLEAYVHKQKE